MARKEKPFDKIMLTKGKLDMYVQYGDIALKGQPPQEFASEVKEAFGYLMDFRNIINGMVRFDEAPDRAVIPYLSDEVLRDLDA